MRRRLFNSRSLRHRLIFKLCVSLSLLLLAGGAGVFVLTSKKLYSQFDTTLKTNAEALAALVKEHPDGSIGIEHEDELFAVFNRRHSNEYFEIWADGKPLARSRSLHGEDLPTGPAKTTRHDVWAFTLPTGKSARAARLVFEPIKVGETDPQLLTGAGRATVVVARRTEDLMETVGTIGAILCGVFALSVALAAFVVAYAIAAGLRPLQSLAQDVRSIHADSLDARLSAEDASDELQPIVQRLNELLARLQQAFERERRFSANLAHELRTPIAELLSTCEVALKWPGSQEDLVNALEDAHASGKNMAEAIETLLTLSRCQSGRQKPDLEAVDISQICANEWPRVEGDAKAKQLQVSLNCDAAVGLLGDRRMLQLVFTNLLSNAVAYTPTGGEIRVRTSSDNGTSTFAVSNRPHEIQPADLKLMFEPFWRKGEARTERDHAGLGLTLCRALCEAQDLECNADITPDGFLQITVSGPSMPLEAGEISESHVEAATTA
jgi:two-component system sensor histidine kinase QseC